MEAMPRSLPTEAVSGGAARPLLDRRLVAGAIAAIPAHVTFVERDALARWLEAVAQQPEHREDTRPDDEPGNATDHVSGERGSKNEEHAAEGAIHARARKWPVRTAFHQGPVASNQACWDTCRMKVTFDLDPELYRSVRVEAARSDRSIRDVVAEALGLWLDQAEESEDRASAVEALAEYERDGGMAAADFFDSLAAETRAEYGSDG
jgi:hypothetical protein